MRGILRKAVRQGLGSAVAQRPLQHEPAQGSDDAAHRQRCDAWPVMAGPRPQGRLERSSRVPYRRRFPADLHDCGQSGELRERGNTFGTVQVIGSTAERVKGRAMTADDMTVATFALFFDDIDD